MDTAILKQSDLQAAISKRVTVRETAAAGNRTWRSVLFGAAVIGAVLGVTRFTQSSAAGHPVLEPSPRALLPVVATAKAERSQHKSELSLPAEIEAYQSTSIYARIGGYLKSWNVDRGDHVAAGQVLAVIDAPEFDQELRRSQADLQQGMAETQQARTELEQARANVEAGEAQILRAEANRELAEKTEDRFKNMIETWAASRQQYDESIRNHSTAKAEVVVAKADLGSRKAVVASRQAAINTAEARVSSLAANVQRLKETERFLTVTAPFEGTITRRFVDVGALISADGAKPLFIVIQDDVLRVKVNVPQTFAPSIKNGQQASVTLREIPGRKFAAKVARTARALDPAARTLAVELELANKDRTILAGSFAQASFTAGAENAPLTIPVSALKITKTGTQVVVVGSENRLHIRTVELGRDLGSRVEVVSGLSGEEALVINPADSLAEGTEVQTVAGSEVAVR